MSVPAKKMSVAGFTSGKVGSPLCVLLYGVPGIGKTHFACDWPKPTILDTHEGSNEFGNVKRAPKPESWSDVMDFVRALTDEPHPYETAIFDVLADLEALLWTELCRRDKGKEHIELVAGGYGRGYKFAVTEWRMFLALCRRLQEKRKMNLIFLDHAVVKTFKNPEGADYDRFVPRVHELAAAAFMAAADCTLFAKWEDYGKKDDDRAVKGKGITTGMRQMYTTHSAAFEAKNRFDLPAMMRLSYDDFDAAVRKSRGESPEAVEKEILGLIGQMPDDDDATAKQAVEYLRRAAGDLSKLKELKHWVAGKVGASAGKG